MSAATVHLLARAELLATVIPSFPQAGPAGLAGSLLWLAWMAALGVFLLRSRPRALRHLFYPDRPQWIVYGYQNRYT